MENIRATSRPALWLMFSIMLVALNLRPSMAAVGPLLSAIRGDIPLSFSLASLLTLLPVMTMGLAMFFGLAISQHLGERRTGILHRAQHVGDEYGVDRRIRKRHRLGRRLKHLDVELATPQRAHAGSGGFAHGGAGLEGDD